MSGAIGDRSEGRTAWAAGPEFLAAAKGAAARARKDESSRPVETCFRLALVPVPFLLGDMAGGRSVGVWRWRGDGRECNFALCSALRALESWGGRGITESRGRGVAGHGVPRN